MYFKRTYFALCQVLQLDVESKMPIGLMMMAIRVHNLEVNIEFDFTFEIEKRIHEQLIKLKEGRSPVNFRHYSINCHLILYQNRNKWSQRLNLRMLDNQGNKLSVQR